LSEMVATVRADISQYDAAMKEVGERPSKEANRAKSGFAAMNRFIKQTQKRAEILGRIKMSPAVTINDRISAPLRTIESKLSRLNTVHKVTLQGVDKVTNVFKRITSTLTSPLMLLGGGVGIAGAIGYPLKLAGEMEQANIAMETMLGSSEKANKFLNNLADFAVKTPFEMPQLRDASKKLLAFGFSSERIIPTLTAVGDAASGLGLGQEGISRITLALGQMKAKAKVSGDEMLQLTESGIPAWDILAKKMGKSTAEVMKLSERGLIPAEKVIDSLLKGMEERFPQMMDKQSRSLFGLVSTLKDYANLKFFTAFGEGIRQAVVPAMQKFTDKLTANEKGLKQVQDRLTEIGRGVGGWIVDRFEGIYYWLERLSSDEKFKKMVWGDKLIFVLNSGLDAVSKWLDGPGGAKVQEIFIKFGEIAVKAWLTGLTSMAKGSVSALANGNILGAAGLAAGFSLLGGGMLLKGALGAGKGLFGAGKWGIEIFDKVLKNKAISKIAKLEKTNPLAAEMVKSTYGIKEVPAAASPVAKAATPAVEAVAKSPVVKAAVTPVAEMAAGTASKAGEGLSMFSKVMPAFNKVAKVAGKAALPLAIAGEAYDVSKAKDKPAAIIKSAGGLGGGWAGAQIGAAIGTAILPGIGTAIGGALGGIGGYLAGKWAASKMVETPAAKAGVVKTAKTEDITAAAAASNANLQKATKDTTSIITSLNTDLQKATKDILAKMGAWGDQLKNITTVSASFVTDFRSMSDRIIAGGSFLANSLINAAAMVAVRSFTTIPVPATVPAAKHATGGVFSSPHLGMVAEAGSEAIIPLSSRMRSRGLDLWQQAGNLLDVGRVMSPMPALAGVGGIGYNVDFNYSPNWKEPAATGSAGMNINVNVSGVNSTFNMPSSEIDEDELAWTIGHKLVRAIINDLENKV